MTEKLLVRMIKYIIYIAGYPLNCGVNYKIQFNTFIKHLFHQTTLSKDAANIYKGPGELSHPGDR